MALYKALSALLPTVALASSSKLLGNQLSYCEPRACKDEIVPENIYCRLTFDVVDFDVDGVGSFRTRGYQRNDTDHSAATPIGPTINVYPGDNLTIELFNNLPQPLLRQRGVHNFYHDFEWTNVHTHGLHISGEEPADSVFVEVGPKCSGIYNYSIPEDHMPGTYWYHPHKHGSTGTHAGGGAVGMIKILDPKGTLPAFIESTDIVPELDLVILGLAMEKNERVEDEMAKCCEAYNNVSMDRDQVQESGACDEFGMAGMIDPKHFTEDRECLKTKLKDLNVKDCERDQFITQQCNLSKVWSAPYTKDDKKEEKHAFLVNGDYNATHYVAANAWTRLRIVYAAIDQQLYFSLPEGCDMELMAKDGVYIRDMPRRTSYAYFGSGNRADFLVRCAGDTVQKVPCPEDINMLCTPYPIKAWFYDETGEMGSSVCDAVSMLDRGSSAETISQTMYDAAGPKATIIPLGTIMAVHETGVETCDLPNISVTYPCYLADLRDVTDSQLAAQAGFSPDRHIHFAGSGGSPLPSINGDYYGNGYFHMGDEPDTKPGQNDSRMAVLRHSKAGGEDTNVFSMPVGSLVNFTLHGVHFHAFHWHVNPFQLQTSYDEFGLFDVDGVETHERPQAFEKGDKDDRAFEPYFKAGDWHDVLMVPAKWCAPVDKYDCTGDPDPSDKHNQTGDKNNSLGQCNPQYWAQTNLSFPVRTNLDRFVSRQVVHCHVLEHEDQGMMTLLDIQEYSKWKEANPMGGPQSGDENNHNKLAYGRHLDKMCYGPMPANAKEMGIWSSKEGMCCAHEDDDICEAGLSCQCGTEDTTTSLLPRSVSKRNCKCRPSPPPSPPSPPPSPPSPPPSPEPVSWLRLAALALVVLLVAVLIAILLKALTRARRCPPSPDVPKQSLPCAVESI